MTQLATASINPTEGEQIARHVGRIERLKLALQKPGISDERRDSLQAELTERQGKLAQIKASIDAALGE